MTAPTDTQRRFLHAVAPRLPIDRVHELYLFAPMRQGGVETGIAVVAAGEAHAVSDAPTVGDDVVAEVLSPGTVAGDVQTPELMRAVMDAAEAAAEAGDEAEPDEVGLDAVASAEDERQGEAHDEAQEIAADALALAQAELDELSDGADAAPVADPSEVERDLAEPPHGPTRAAARFTVFTARYRLQLKGPDRGKWEADVVEEADAPLLTVDAVVRGVQRRIGDAAEVERLSGDDLRRLLAGPP